MSRVRLEQEDENASTVATAKPPANKRFSGRQRASGYPAQSGTTTSAANFVHAASARNAPRANGVVRNQKANTRRTGMIASFVFELDTYCVKG